MFKSTVIQIFIAMTIFIAYTSYKALSMIKVNDTIPLAQLMQRAKLNDRNVLSDAPIETQEETQTAKQTVLYFFAPWCHVCSLSISNLNLLQAANDNVNIIAIALDYQNTDEVAEFIANNPINAQVILGDSQLKKLFNISAYPSYYVLDEKNRVMARSIGYSTSLGLYLRTL